MEVRCGVVFEAGQLDWTERHDGSVRPLAVPMAVNVLLADPSGHTLEQPR